MFILNLAIQKAVTCDFEEHGVSPSLSLSPPHLCVDCQPFIQPVLYSL